MNFQFKISMIFFTFLLLRKSFVEGFVSTSYAAHQQAFRPKKLSKGISHFKQTSSSQRTGLLDISNVSKVNSWESEATETTDVKSPFEVPKSCPPNLPLPDLLHEYLTETYPSMSRARKAIRKGKVTLNEKRGRCGDAVLPGDILVFGKGWQSPRRNKRRDEMKIVYEDEWMAIVDKPTGVSVHGHGGHSLAPHLPQYLQSSSLQDALDAPQPAHRLDAPTGGLLVIAKTKSALRHLCSEFELRRAKKTYCALVVGRLEGKGRITDPIDEKEAITLFEAKNHTRSSAFGWLTTVELHPETGRKHQLRRHLAGIDHPILGDMRYCKPGFFKEMHGLFLWAIQLQISHPFDGRVKFFTMEKPEKLDKAIRHHEKQYIKKNDASPPMNSQ